MPKFRALSCWQNADPCPTPWPAGPCPQAPGIYRVQEEASGFSPTLALLPPGPQPFPFDAVMLGITDCHSLPSPFPEAPSSFPRFSILVINVKKHNLPSPPVGSPTVLSLPDPSYCNNYDTYLWCSAHDYRAVFMLFCVNDGGLYYSCLSH